ncbi:hypothetical protein SAMN06265371_11028 [Lutibacter agarilyticus]|uniref:Outer membrane protein beta-barrel domain-containing protein n=1 Tax=Lutibacter agarilyticus TaxID=1109740 RepID=A0A238YN73_9FLAO|nr:hypothetical protein [Lutibacter agarilyticus]SNR72442.1 hypothetical protein SAMN06265371_11028 [Lutibacter agarilyticus]
MKKIKVILLLSFLVLTTNTILAQKLTEEKDSTYTAYELLSSYYNNHFKPFKKNNIYIGFAFALEDKKLQNVDYLIKEVIDGEKIDYNIHLKGGYYTGDYGMVGINFNYYQDKFIGETFSDPDTIQSNSFTRGFGITPNFRSSIPLTANERLSFFSEFGLTFGKSTTITRDIKNIDEINKSYATNYNFRVGISPGITFFAMENFAFEVQLNVLGYELNVTEKTTNDIDESSKVRQNVDFNINILSLDLGLAYYFGAKK